MGLFNNTLFKRTDFWLIKTGTSNTKAVIKYVTIVTSSKSQALASTSNLRTIRYLDSLENLKLKEKGYHDQYCYDVHVLL